MSSDPVILSDILARARELNEASDAANIILGELEKRLQGANIGLSFWLENKPLLKSDSTGDIGPAETSSYTADVLGYARIEGKWHLAVKRIRVVSGPFQSDKMMPAAFANVFADRERHTFSDGEPQPLLKASREIRLAALRVLQEFLTTFAAKIGQTVKEIEAATVEIIF